MRQRGRDRDLEQDAELGCAKGLADPDMYLFDGFDAGIRVDDAGNERGKKHNGCLCHNADAQKDDHDRDPGDRRNIPNKVKHGAERRVHGFPPGHHNAERHADTRAEAEAQQGDAQAGEDVGGERSPIRLFRSPFCYAGFQCGDRRGKEGRGSKLEHVRDEVPQKEEEAQRKRGYELEP